MAIVEIPLNSFGLSGEQDPSKFKTGFLSVAENTDYASSGRVLQKEGGTLRRNSMSVAGSPVAAGTDYWATATTQRSVIYCGGKLFKNTSVTNDYSVTLKSGLSSTAIGQFLYCGAELAGNSRKLFFFNGNDAVQVLIADGTSTSNVTDGASEWTGTNQPSFGFLFRNSVLAGGASNDPSRIYASKTTDHEDFNDAAAYTLLVYPGVGQRLVSGISAFGKGYLFKYPVGIFSINDVSTTIANWFTEPVSVELGVANTPYACTGLGEGGVALLSHEGDVLLMQESSGTLTGLQFVNITKALNLRRFLQQNADLSNVRKGQMFWYNDKQQLHVTYGGLDANGSPTGLHDRRMIFDFNYETVRVSWSTKDIQQSIWGELDTSFTHRPFIGDDQGHVSQTDQADHTTNSIPYELNLTTYASDFSDVNPEFAKKKLFRRMHLEYIPTGDYNLPIAIIIDDKNYGSVQFTQNSNGAVAIGSAGVFRRSREIAGEGYYFSAYITEGTINSPKLGRLWVEFEPTRMAY